MFKENGMREQGNANHFADNSEAKEYLLGLMRSLSNTQRLFPERYSLT